MQGWSEFRLSVVPHVRLQSNFISGQSTLLRALQCPQSD